MIAKQNINQIHYSYWWNATLRETDLNIVENTLIEKLTDRGFNIIDHSIKSKTIKISAPYKMVTLSDKDVKNFGNLFAAEVVIYGKALAKTDGSVMGTSMKSAQATLSLKAVNTVTGQVITAATRHSAAVHINEMTAGNKALELAVSEIADSLLNQIIEHWNQDNKF